MEQMNLFEMEIISYPRIENVTISKVQAMFIINALKLYEINLKKIDREDLIKNHLFQLSKKRELKEIRELAEYLEDKIGGGNRSNNRICKTIDDVGLDPFNLIGE